MILSGIFGCAPENQGLFDKLQSLTSAHITQKKQVFKRHFLDVITGETSLLTDQGNIIATPNAVLAGKVFSKSTYQPITTEALYSMTKASSQSFVDSYWGNYLCVKADEQKGSVTILRDPVGQFPLFYTQLSGGEVLFSSELSVIYKILDKKPSFNWNYFSHYLLRTFITTECTAFEGIFELPHGCQLILSHTKGGCLVGSSLVWNPADYCQECKQYKGLEHKKQEIIETITNVMKSWVNGAESVFLDLSGGLDSSSLLLFLSQSTQPTQTLRAINLFHPESGDERKHARNISAETNVPLIEVDTSHHLPFTPIARIPNFYPNWPIANLNTLATQRDNCELLNPYRNLIHISGHGGDHIFSCPPIVSSLADYLIERGPKGFTKKLKEISTIYRRPLLPILRSVYQGLLQYTLRMSYQSEFYSLTQEKRAPYFSKEIFALEKKASPHPCFSDPKLKKSLPGKFALIDIIYNGLATIKGNMHGHHHSMFYPLFSQPMLELALATPTYESYQQDYNRYHFRKAVSDHFKTNLVWRKDKGEVSGIIQRGLFKNESYVLERCLEGKLAQAGLIDKDLFHKNVKDITMGQTKYLWPMMNVISAEIFMEYWS